MAQNLTTLNNQRLNTETSTERHEALAAATSLAALCGSMKRTDLGYDNTVFYFDFDPVFGKRHHGVHNFGRPRITVTPDNRIKYFVSSMNVDRLDMLIRQLRQHEADLTVYDEWTAGTNFIFGVPEIP
jgi:hypothetical protein